jgi:glutamate/tyrosine decarboxylase-like PLP-dependent enzyme
VVIERAADTLGIGTRAVRRIPTDDSQRMIVAALEEAIGQDLRDGVRPIAVIGTAGTTGTGAIDPLGELANLAERHGLWFHVDACYGGAAVLSDALRPLLSGIERADSISFDAHKWMYAPYASSFVLVRDIRTLSSSCGIACPIMRDDEHEESGADLGQVGVEFSRSFNALKLWVSLLAHGSSAYARRIDHDVELAHYLAARVVDRPDFELLGPPGLSVCCFRYRPPEVEDKTDPYLNVLNNRLITALQRDGRCSAQGSQSAAGCGCGRASRTSGRRRPTSTNCWRWRRSSPRSFTDSGRPSSSRARDDAEAARPREAAGARYLTDPASRPAVK